MGAACAPGAPLSRPGRPSLGKSALYFHKQTPSPRGGESVSGSVDGTWTGHCGKDGAGTGPGEVTPSAFPTGPPTVPHGLLPASAGGGKGRLLRAG